MKTQRILFGLTVINLGLLVTLLLHGGTAAAGGGSGILRGRGLEIVNEKGEVRASITVHPPDPKYKMPDGKVGYPETVVLRLKTSDGRPGIKMDASAKGSGLLASGPSPHEDWHGVQISSDRCSVKVRGKDGKEQILKPY